MLPPLSQIPEKLWLLDKKASAFQENEIAHRICSGMKYMKRMYHVKNAAEQSDAELANMAQQISTATQAGQDL